MKNLICIFLICTTNVYAEIRSFDAILDEIVAGNIQCNGELGYKNNQDNLEAIIFNLNKEVCNCHVFISRNFADSTCFVIYNHGSTNDVTLVIENELNQPIYSKKIHYSSSITHSKCTKMIPKKNLKNLNIAKL